MDWIASFENTHRQSTRKLKQARLSMLDRPASWSETHTRTYYTPICCSRFLYWWQGGWHK